MTSTKFSFVTSSSDKFSEASLLLPGLVQIQIDLPEIQELDPKKIIAAKLLSAAEHCSAPLIVEDTGLYCEALSDLPGPLVKWFLKALEPKGLAELVLQGKSDRALAKTVLGVVGIDGQQHFFEGIVAGKIVSPRGTGFGWDSIFQPQGSNKTFGEMDAAEKSSFSMRALAFQNLKAALL